jgi:hypothetical protein
MFDLMILEIKKENIIKKDLTPLREFLSMLEENPKIFYKKGHITFGGYDDDVREIYEIPEIRNWCLKAIQKYPYLFYFIEDKLEGQKNIIVCIADIQAFQPGPRKSILQWHKEGFNTTDENFPKISIKVEFPSVLFNKIALGLMEFGEKVNDVKRTEKLLNELKIYV